MKLKMRLSAIALSLSMATMSFLMAGPRKVSALENEGQSVSASVTEQAQEVSAMKEESEAAKEKPDKTIGKKEFEDLYIKMNKKFAKDYAKKALIMQVIIACCFVSGIYKDITILNFVAMGVANIVTLLV